MGAGASRLLVLVFVCQVLILFENRAVPAYRDSRNGLRHRAERVKTARRYDVLRLTVITFPA